MGDEHSQDYKFRLRLTLERRAEVLNEHEASGLTHAEFAKQTGIERDEDCTLGKSFVSGGEAITFAMVAAPVAVRQRAERKMLFVGHPAAILHLVFVPCRRHGKALSYLRTCSHACPR